MYASGANGASGNRELRKSADGVTWSKGTMAPTSVQIWGKPAWVNNKWFRYSKYLAYDYTAYRATSSDFLSWTQTDSGNIYVDGRQIQNIESMACSEEYAVGWGRTTNGYYYLLRSNTPWSGFGADSVLIDDTGLSWIDSMGNTSGFVYNKFNNTFYIVSNENGQLDTFRSTNNGATWTRKSFDCEEYGFPTANPEIMVCNGKNAMYLKFGYGDSCKIFASFDGLATLQEVSIDGDTEFGDIDYVMETFVATNTDYRNTTWYPRVYWSPDGINFKMKELTQFVGLTINSFASDGEKIIFGTSGNRYSTIAKTNGYITCTP